MLYYKMIKPFNFNNFETEWGTNKSWTDTTLMALFIPSYQINQSYFEANVINTNLKANDQPDGFTVKINVTNEKLSECTSIHDKDKCTKFDIIQTDTNIKNLYKSIRDNPFSQYDSDNIINSIKKCIIGVNNKEWYNLDTLFTYFQYIYNFKIVVCMLPFNIFTKKNESHFVDTHEFFDIISKNIHWQLDKNKIFLNENMICINVKYWHEKYGNENSGNIDQFNKITTLSGESSMIINNIKYNLVSIAYKEGSNKLSVFKDLTNNIWYKYDSLKCKKYKFTSFIDCFNNIKFNLFGFNTETKERNYCYMIFHNVGPINNNKEIIKLLEDIDTLYNRKQNIQQLLNLINY